MYGTKSSVHNMAWSLRRTLRMSPMQKLLRELRRSNTNFGEMDALEMFSADGSRHTLDYFSKVRSLDAWELNASNLDGLRQNLPGATIKITDSFQEIQSTPNTYNMVVLDESTQNLGHDDKRDSYFQMLENHLFRVLRSHAVLIMNLVPEPLLQIPEDRASASLGAYLRARGEFYSAANPEVIPVEAMVPAYRRVADKNGFEMYRHLIVRRTMRTRIHYLAMLVRRKASAEISEAVAE